MFSKSIKFKVFNFWLSGAPIEVLAGTNTWRSGGQRYRSKMYYIHGWYNNPKNAYDVGLIRIDGDIQYNDKVNWIALWPDAPPSGTWLVATGWGSIGVSWDQLVFLRFCSWCVSWLLANNFCSIGSWSTRCLAKTWYAGTFSWWMSTKRTRWPRKSFMCREWSWTWSVLC